MSIHGRQIRMTSAYRRTRACEQKPTPIRPLSRYDQPGPIAPRLAGEARGQPFENWYES